MGSRCWDCGEKLGRCYECGEDCTVPEHQHRCPDREVTDTGSSAQGQDDG